jgi:hypothetical protein
MNNHSVFGLLHNEEPRENIKISLRSADEQGTSKTPTIEISDEIIDIIQPTIIDLVVGDDIPRTSSSGLFN